MKKFLGVMLGFGLVASSLVSSLPAAANSSLDLEAVAVNVQDNGLAVQLVGKCPMHGQFGSLTKVSTSDGTTETLGADSDGTFSLFSYSSSGVVEETVTCTYYSGDSEYQSIKVTAKDKKGPQVKVTSALGAYVVQTGEPMTVQATDVKAGAAVEFTMYSAPTKLGTADADSKGVAKLTVKVPSDKAVGYHFIEVYDPVTKTSGVVHLMVKAPKAQTKKPGAPRTGA